MRRIKFSRITKAAREQGIDSIFDEFGWIMSKIKHADDDIKGYCAIRLATVT